MKYPLCLVFAFCRFSSEPLSFKFQLFAQIPNFISKHDQEDHIPYISNIQYCIRVQGVFEEAYFSSVVLLKFDLLFDTCKVIDLINV